MKTLSTLFVLFAIFASASTQAADDILTRLNSLSGVTATETTTVLDVSEGIRVFAVEIEQPVDHFDPSAGTFKQRLALSHKGYSEPMVLQTSGYAIFSIGLSRVARAFGANQIQVEHRYFETSTPAKLDWTKLTVRQSAEDFHKIVEKFKPLYPARWVNTGASKGGMTSVYHRRYYPNDLDGTVADVAPLSFSTDDQRYVDFVDQVGGAPFADCRAKLESFQRTALQHRKDILPGISGTFKILGDKDTAFEHAVIEAPFVFWQYGNPASLAMGCSKIPAETAPVSEVASYLTALSDPSGYADEGLAPFVSYFYQAGAELGAPAGKLIHLADLLTRPYNLDLYLPAPVTFTDVTMRDVEHWVATEAKSVMFVYGEFDPWTAGAYRQLNPSNDNHWYEVPAANHGANYTQLPPAQRTEALATLSRWFGKAPIAPMFVKPSLRKSEREDLEDVEFRIRRKYRL